MKKITYTTVRNVETRTMCESETLQNTLNITLEDLAAGGEPLWLSRQGFLDVIEKLYNDLTEGLESDRSKAPFDLAELNEIAEAVRALPHEAGIIYKFIA